METRTPDPRVANAMLYQLNYSPQDFILLFAVPDITECFNAGCFLATAIASVT